MAHIANNVNLEKVYPYNSSDVYYCNPTNSDAEELCNLCYFDSIPIIGAKIEVLNLTHAADYYIG